MVATIKGGPRGQPRKVAVEHRYDNGIGEWAERFRIGPVVKGPGGGREYFLRVFSRALSENDATRF